jgi:predicted nucleic acid-binding Zn ribbon protein
MLRDDSMPETRSEAARALLAGSERECPGCGKPLAGRQRACSGKCRAKLSRERSAAAHQHRDDELHVLVLAARQAIETLERRLADPT